jgi:hypothetical protein
MKQVTKFYIQGNAGQGPVVGMPVGGERWFRTSLFCTTELQLQCPATVRYRIRDIKEATAGWKAQSLRGRAASSGEDDGFPKESS